MTEEVALIPLKKEQYKTNYRTTVRSMFRDGTPDLVFYPKLFEEAKSKSFPLPPKSRDTYLFLHYETLRIFGTIAGFSQRNLFAPEREATAFAAGGIAFHSPVAMLLRNPKRKENGVIVFDDGSFSMLREIFISREKGVTVGLFPSASS